MVVCVQYVLANVIHNTHSHNSAGLEITISGTFSYVLLSNVHTKECSPCTSYHMGARALANLSRKGTKRLCAINY